MKELTHLKDNLYGIEVPADILGEIQVGKFLSKNIIRYVRAGQPSNIIFYSEELPEGNWKILGTASKDNISFDPTPYLKNKRVCIEDGKYKFLFVDYGFDNGIHSGAFFETPEESLYSLLKGKGYYWENPMGEGFYFKVCLTHESSDKEIERERKWLNFEQKLIKGQLLFLTKKDKNINALKELIGDNKPA